MLLDLVMKGMYGLDVLAKLRELDRRRAVIVVSADIQTSSRELVGQAGASGVPQQAVRPSGYAERARRAS